MRRIETATEVIARLALEAKKKESTAKAKATKKANLDKKQGK